MGWEGGGWRAGWGRQAGDHTSKQEPVEDFTACMPRWPASYVGETRTRRASTRQLLHEVAQNDCVDR